MLAGRSGRSSRSELVRRLKLLGRRGPVRARCVSGRRWLPVMKASHADVQHAAHHGDGIVRLLRSDPRIRIACRRSSSLERRPPLFARSPAPSATSRFHPATAEAPSRSSLASPFRRPPRDAFSSLSQLRNVNVRDPQILSELALRLIAGPDEMARLPAKLLGIRWPGPGHLNLSFPGYDRKRSMSPKTDHPARNPRPQSHPRGATGSRPTHRYRDPTRSSSQREKPRLFRLAGVRRTLRSPRSAVL
jgi:hypothetical protein